MRVDDRALVLLGLSLIATTGFGGCRGSEARQLEIEAALLGQKIDLLRQAPNEAKAPRLSELEKAVCQGLKTCELKALCVQAYRTHLQALDASTRARDLLRVPDGGVLVSIQAAQELARADRDLERSRELTERCAGEQGALRRETRAR